MNDYDFSGWATKNDLRCSDGRTIRQDAFKHHDGKTVPLVWNHQHNDPTNILGHALLENRPEGVYVYGKFNNTANGKDAKECIHNGDIDALSIYANRLRQNNGDVLHGDIREVSLVIAGANPGAYIDTIIQHSDEEGDECTIYTGETINVLQHGEQKTTASKSNNIEGEIKMSKEKTVQDVLDTLNDEQTAVMEFLIGQAIEDANDEGDGEGMKHNVFDNGDFYTGDVLTHADMEDIIHDAKRGGSLRDAVLAHGIEQIDYLFPDAKNVTDKPGLIAREQTWVSKVMGSTHKTPFSRIKSLFADLTEDEARAKGYIKGTLKKEEVFSLLKRTTTPTTIYKKQKLDRDDVIDITDFDVVAWLKSEMRMMLDEEIARAILVGDGRLNSSDDKINESNIRPVWKDEDLYAIKASVKVTADASADDKAKAFIRAAVKSRKDYKGSGSPTLYTTEDLLTDCLLMEDKMGRVIYDTVDKLATALRVKEIITVPVMEGLTRDEKVLMGIIVNLTDYNIGADSGGAVNMFDDFDIDYNAQKYLIETRCSGALIKPYSAIILEATLAEDVAG